MVVEWVGPLLTGFKHRTDIKELLAGGLSLVFGKKTEIAFTGMQGVGKSVLLDQLTGKASRPAYQPPLQSQRLESGSVKSGGRRMRVGVIPGQLAEPRHVALDQLFRARKPVDGVVHLVSYGHATSRNPDAVDALVRDLKINTVAKYQKLQLERELEDLAQTCQAIREAHRKARSPKWLVVAVDKIDLFHDVIAKARRYYSPDADSPFAEQLRALTAQVGTDNFRWEAAPVCGCLAPFEWNGKALVPQLREEERQAYLAQLLRLLESYCR